MQDTRHSPTEGIPASTHASPIISPIQPNLIDHPHDADPAGELRFQRITASLIGHVCGVAFGKARG